jgi:hypothetical protein
MKKGLSKYGKKLYSQKRKNYLTKNYRTNTLGRIPYRKIFDHLMKELYGIRY